MTSYKVDKNVKNQRTYNRGNLQQHIAI